jgi:hypothetical protein
VLERTLACKHCDKETLKKIALENDFGYRRIFMTVVTAAFGPPDTVR